MRPAVLALAVLAACASTSATPEVSVALAQVSGSRDMFFFAGPVNVEYEVTVTNPTNEPVTLRRLDLKTVGAGAYTLRTPSQPLQVTVRPGMVSVVRVSANAISRGGNANSAEPVTVRGTAYFDAPSGAFTRVFNESFSPGVM
jgi:hypothetical protein